MNPVWLRALALVCIFGAVVLAVEVLVRWMASSRAEGKAINLRLKMIGKGRSHGETMNLLRRADSAVPRGLPPVLDRLAHKFERMLMQAQLTIPTGQLMLALLIAPLAIFFLNQASEVCPLNHAAVTFAESRWAPDEAVRQLTPDQISMIERIMDGAWINPVTADWRDLTIDLGSGPAAVHALPKLSGEVIMMFPVSGQEPGGEDAVTILTRRQREIMDWIAEGKTSAEAAIILGISPRTVEKHLEAVFQRLGVENRIAAMRRYLDLKRGV